MITERPSVLKNWAMAQGQTIQRKSSSLDKKNMRLRFLVLTLLLGTSVVSADDSSVYLCRLDGLPSDEVAVRMKKYYDSSERMEMGKVDRLFNSEVLESTPTKVLQVPLLDKDSCVQIWYGPDLTLDAQLTYDQGTREFHATYKKTNEKMSLICKEIRD